MSESDESSVEKLREQNARLHYELADTQLRHQLHLSKARFVIMRVMAYVADDKTRTDIEDLLDQIDRDMKTSGDLFDTAPSLGRRVDEF